MDTLTRGFALTLMALALALTHFPGESPGLALKTGVFCLLPLLAWLVAPRELGRAAMSEFRSVAGLVAIALVAWVAFLDFQAQGVAAGETPAALLAGWLLLQWIRALSDDDRPRFWGVAVAASAAAVAAIACLQIFPMSGTSWALLPGAEQPVSTLGNRNQVAYFLALALPECLALAASGGGLPPLMGSLASGGALLVVVLAGSRGAWLALAAAGVARLCLPGRRDEGRPLPRFVLLSVVLLALPLALPLAIPRVAKTFSPGKVQSLQTRIFAWETLWPEVAHGDPVGRGPGSFARRFPRLKEARLRALPDEQFLDHARFARTKLQLHNEPLELVFEWGTVGAGLSALLLLLWLGRFGRDLAGVARPREWARRRMGLVVLAAGMVAAGFHFPLQAAPQAFLLLGAVARALGAPRSRAAPGGLLSAFAALALVLVPGWFGARRLFGEWSLIEGARAAQARRPAEALDHYERARTLIPGPRAYNQLGALALMRSEFNLAVELFQRAEAVEPTFSQALNVGIAEFTRNRNQPAGEAFQRAWFRQPSEETGFYLGAWFEHVGKKEDAAGVWERARRLPGFVGRAGYALGRLRWLQGRGEEAVRILQTNLSSGEQAPPPEPGQAAPRARLRMATLRLLEHVHRSRSETAEADKLAAQFKAEFPDVDSQALGKPGQKEGIL